VTPRRATLVVALLCLAAVAAAVGGTWAVERAVPVLRQREAEAYALAVPRLDVHQHLGPRTIDMAVQIARRHGIDALVNLSGGTVGGGLEEQLAAAGKYPGRVHTFMNLDLRGCCDAAWAAREAERLARGQALGARGVAVTEVRLASPVLEPVWAACAELGLPVTVEVDEAASELAPATLVAVARHPRVRFVAGRFAGAAAEPERATRLLERHPNLHLDLGSAVPFLGRVPEAARAALLAHPDRVLFATDVQYVSSPEQSAIVLGAGQPVLLDANLLGGKARRVFFESALRFLETRDPAIPSPSPELSPDDLRGLGLPRRALDALYWRNAERLLSVRVPRDGA
jgi:predicted TIM-barrel fold metal-dependent hydrolase